ncbi:peroxide stress protein YaaA [Phaeacidiphilus oryzae]|uniref:peroxide stress protein YaaA n=1 Tax=Phaeacidiphilus oryzae TaxID=348818 RepID=UPI00056483C2|nr:peroxide stress protein YaaA [Phaeacidiphilus oryzae]
MLVLLPPSEGKAGTGGGPRLDPAGLSLPGLREARERVLDALVALSAEGGQQALDVLGLSPGQAGELARNAALREAATLPAAELYTGVLYDALELATLGPEARRRATSSVLVASGLWGALRLDDRVPPYRCSIGVKGLPVGPGGKPQGLAAYWKRPLADTLPAASGDGLVLDLRSGAYAAAWKPAGEVARRTATVRVLHEREVGGVLKRSVVSHFNKATKGRLLRALLESGADPVSPDELVVALRDLKHTVEVGPATPSGIVPLDVVVSEI